MTTYEPRGGARDLLLARDDTLLVSGPAGTGKSVAALMKIHATSLMVPNTVTLLLRQTAASLGASTLRTYEQFVAAQELASEHVTWFGGSGSNPAAYRYPNGSLIIPGGMDRPGKFLSMDVDRVVIDEANQVSVTAVETVATRLRGKAATYKQMLLLTNPDHPDHHLLKMADEGRARHIHSLHTDNPYLYDRNGNPTKAGAEYLARLASLTGVRKARYLEGKWVAAEGMVYDDWTSSDNVIDWFPIPKEWPLLLSVDFGYSDAFVCQWWRIDPDKRMYLTREIHKSQELVEDHARHILKIMEEHKDTEPAPFRIVCDHQLEDRKTLERHLKRPTVPAKKPITRGVQFVQSRVRKAGDGKPRLMVFKDCVVGRDEVAEQRHTPRGFASEVLGYVWETIRGTDGIPKELPRDLNNHSMDAGRYAVAEMDWHEESKVGNPAAAPAAQPKQGSKWSSPTGRPGSSH